MVYIFPQHTWAFIVAVIITGGMVICAVIVDWLARRSPVTDHYEDDYPYYMENCDAERYEGREGLPSPEEAG